MASYHIVVEPDVTTLVAKLSEADQEYVLVDLAIALGRDPHKHGEVWMTFGAETYRVVRVGNARLVVVVNDTTRTVTLTSLAFIGS